MPNTGPVFATVANQTSNSNQYWFTSDPLTPDTSGALSQNESAPANSVFPTQTETLQFSGFSFGLLSNAEIIGIAVTVHLAGASNNANVNVAHLVNNVSNGSELGTPLVGGGNTWHDVNFGGATNLGGLTWSADDVNNLLAFEFAATSNNPDAISVSSCSIIVYWEYATAAIAFVCDQTNNAVITCETTQLLAFTCDQTNNAVIDCDATKAIAFTCDQTNNAEITCGTKQAIAFHATQTNNAVIACGTKQAIAFHATQTNNAVITATAGTITEAALAFVCNQTNAAVITADVIDTINGIEFEFVFDARTQEFEFVTRQYDFVFSARVQEFIFEARE